MEVSDSLPQQTMVVDSSGDHIPPPLSLACPITCTCLCPQYSCMGFPLYSSMATVLLNILFHCWLGEAKVSQLSLGALVFSD